MSTDPLGPWLAQRRRRMLDHLRRACEHFGAALDGEPIEGLDVRSVSVRVVVGSVPRWLRVGAEWHRWVQDSDTADHWTGIPDSNAVVGVPKPLILGSTEWDEDQDRRVRADLMTLMPGRPCSDTDELRQPLDLPEAWWNDLRRSVDLIRQTQTSRFATRGERPSTRVRKVFGDTIADAFSPTRWETMHGDLHWANVLGPELGVLDWELWGPGPAGTDPASLYLFSLSIPDVASRVWATFEDALDSQAGEVARIGVASRILFHAREEAQYPHLAPLVEEHVRPLLARVR
jgi:hypothetical protein